MLPKTLKNLLPMLQSSALQGTGVEKASLSSILLATSHSRSTFEMADSHLHDCPVINGSAPLYSVLTASETAARPCQGCVSFAVHHLACDLFCRSFCSKCQSPVSISIPQELSRQILEDFSSVDQFRSYLLSFAVSTMRPGRTWIVYELNKKKISVIALPCNEVPVSLGLWPLGVVDMTGSTLCKEISSFMRLRDEGTQSTITCTWGRKSRISHLNFSGANEVSPLSLNQIKFQHVQNAIDQMDWNFVEKQFFAARQYSLCNERSTAQAAWGTRLKERAVDLALGSVRSVDTTEYSLASKIDDSGSAPLVETKKIERSTLSNEGSLLVAVGRSESGEMGRKPASSIQDNTKSDDPEVIEHKETGIWEYRYSNGNRTFLHSDGLKVYEEKNLKSTVYPDGSALFEYPDGVSIRQTQNKRTTIFPDGTTKEELL